MNNSSQAAAFETNTGQLNAAELEAFRFGAARVQRPMASAIGHEDEVHNSIHARSGHNDRIQAINDAVRAVPFSATSSLPTKSTT